MSPRVPLSFEGFPLEDAIADTLRRVDLPAASRAIDSLATHARLVASRNERLHLTAILDPAEFVERHLFESLFGATLLDPSREGPLLDLGSGNGYPAIPLAVARPGLRPWLAEASPAKASFLTDALAAAKIEGEVLAAQVQRPSDLVSTPLFTVISCRAMGGWQRIVPRLAGALAPGGEILLWVGEVDGEIWRRVAWRRFRGTGALDLPGRENASIRRFRVNH